MDINIAGMTNKSRGEYAYTVLDVDSIFPEDVANKLKEIEGIIRVRVL